MALGEDSSQAQGIDSKERGRREWIRDMRRRLWWCVYSFDRLVSTCVGRPFGITDQVITTEWPSVLDDKDITTEGFLASITSLYPASASPIRDLAGLAVSSSKEGACEERGTRKSVHA